MSTSQFRTGRFSLKEISGAALLPGDRLLLVSDEYGIWVLEDASHVLASPPQDPIQVVPLRLQSNNPLFPGEEEDPVVDDLEDIAWDGEKHAYLVTSHSLSRKGKDKKARRQLVRLTVDPGRGVIQNAQRTGALQAALEKLSPLKSALERTPAQCGLNIEGLEYSPERKSLLVGLRSPTFTVKTDRGEGVSQEDALLLEVTNLDALFEDSKESEDGEEAEFREVSGSPVPGAELLDLGGQGLRGLCRHGSHLFFLAGLSVDPNHSLESVPWTLWCRSGEEEPMLVGHSDPLGAEFKGALREAIKRNPQATRSIQLGYPEALCSLTLGGEPGLLFIEDTQESRFVWMPW